MRVATCNKALLNWFRERAESGTVDLVQRVRERKARLHHLANFVDRKSLGQHKVILQEHQGP